MQQLRFVVCLQLSVVRIVVLHTMLYSFAYYTLYFVLLLLFLVNIFVVLYCYIHLQVKRRMQHQLCGHSIDQLPVYQGRGYRIFKNASIIIIKQTSYVYYIRMYVPQYRLYCNFVTSLITFNKLNKVLSMVLILVKYVLA